MEKKILDATCGARTMWFNKNHPNVIYCDSRSEQHCQIWPNAGRCVLNISPDIVCNFTELPFEDNSFPLVVFLAFLVPIVVTAIGMITISIIIWIIKKLFGNL